MRKVVSFIVVTVFLVYATTVYASGLDDLFRQAEKIERQIRNADKILNLNNDKEKSDKIEEGSNSYQQNEPFQINEFDGEVVIPVSNHTWYFKMAWFNAAACSRIYYSVNGGKPKFLVEYAGIRPPVNAAIPIEGLNEGDSVVFFIKTHYYRWYKMIPSTDRKHFKVKMISNYKYYYQFEDAAGYDSAYNDGAFYFYMDGYGQKNRYVRILSYDLCRNGNGYKISGRIKIFDEGDVKSKIVIRDNRWKIADIINLDFYNEQGNSIHSFSFELPYSDYTRPNYTSIWQVYFKGESDARIRVLKNCSGKCLSESGNIFGSYTKNPFFFVGNVYRLNKGISRLPDFSKLKAIDVVYTPTLNVAPRDFRAGFSGVKNMIEWFGVDYKGYFYVRKSGVYRFSLLSDDGSQLLIDNRLIINNDGLHPPRLRYGSVYISRGLHKIEVKYFQGPRYQVALVLSIKENGRYVPFDIRKYTPVKFISFKCRSAFVIDSGLIFADDDYQILPDGVKLLNTIASYIKHKGYRIVRVSGGVDKLSRKRTVIVKNYMEGFDIKPISTLRAVNLTNKLKVTIYECKY